MGNCQAAEAATVVIHVPAENKIEKIYWSVSASDVMGSHPGHYVAMVVTSPSLKNDNGSPLKQLKLLRPDDTLLIGHVYRLVSFEEVMKEFAAKKCVKLGKLLRDGREVELNTTKKQRTKKQRTKKEVSGRPNPTEEPDNVGKIRVSGEENGVGGGGGYPRRHGGGRGGAWRPALHSIPEVGVS